MAVREGRWEGAGRERKRKNIATGNEDMEKKLKTNTLCRSVLKD